jgi:hypothetical protein
MISAMRSATEPTPTDKESDPSVSLKSALVLTTIFDPVVLDSYLENFEAYGHRQNVHVILIPDRKTPDQAYKRCISLRDRGLQVACPSFDEQETFLKQVGFPPDLIPYNSDNRRNVGYLMALESDADFVISIDDDNYCRPDEDFFSEHGIVCRGPSQENVVESSTGWFNACSLIKLDRPGTTYARGFPYFARHKDESPRVALNPVEVHINAGLWLGDPDVDGMTWLVNPAHSTQLLGQPVVLGRDTWSPVNTQNTSLRREAIASYYFVRMGDCLAGVPIDRYGDIFSGYFAQACARHLGGAVRLGRPIVDHRRNGHNYMRDAFNEWGCILVLEDLLPWLTQEARICGGSYAEAYESLSQELEEAVEKFKGLIWTQDTRDYFHRVAQAMRHWVRACDRLSGKSRASKA